MTGEGACRAPLLPVAGQDERPGANRWIGESRDRRDERGRCLAAGWWCSRTANLWACRTRSCFWSGHRKAASADRSGRRARGSVGKRHGRRPLVARASARAGRCWPRIAGGVCGWRCRSSGLPGRIAPDSQAAQGQQAWFRQCQSRSGGRIAPGIAPGCGETVPAGCRVRDLRLVGRKRRIISSRRESPFSESDFHSVQFPKRGRVLIRARSSPGELM